MFCSFFKGFPIDGSFSRTSINGAVGAQSPVSGLVAAVMIGVAMLVLIPFLQFTPKAALAAIVIQACVGLVDFGEGITLWHTAKRDCVVFWIVMLATLLLGVDAALMIGILLSWVLFLTHHPPPRVALLGVTSDTKGLPRDLFSSTGPARVHVAVISQFGGFDFRSVSLLKSTVVKTQEASKAAVMVLDCTNVQALDGGGVHALRFLAEHLSQLDCPLILAGLPATIRQSLLSLTKFEKALATGPKRWAVDIDEKLLPEKDEDSALLELVPASAKKVCDDLIPRLLVRATVRSALAELAQVATSKRAAGRELLGPEVAVHTTFAKADLHFVEASENWVL